MIARDCTPLGLMLVTLAAVAVVVSPGAEPAPGPDISAVPSLTDAWPDARVTVKAVPGAPYTPLAYLDSGTSAGITQASDSIRLTLGDGVIREVPPSGSPRFVLATALDALVWLELSGITARHCRVTSR